jgi:hypothetical protein
MEMPAPDLHHLRAAVGWLELGNAGEAILELDQLSEPLQGNPDVLETRWLALAKNQRWDAAAKVGRALIAAAPDRATSWLHHSYALRRATGGGLLAAFNALAPVVEKFPTEATIPYNLACYACQMQRDANETLDWLRRAMQADEGESIVAMALDDPDLEPLHGEIARLAKSA